MSIFLCHCGPDDLNEYLSVCGRVKLAHRRLSTIDLSKFSLKPMSNEDKTIL